MAIKHLNILLDEKEYNKVIRAKKTTNFDNWGQFLLYLIELHNKTLQQTEDKV